MENCCAPAVDARVMPATGAAEREAAVSMVEAIPGHHCSIVGAGKASGIKASVAQMRTLGTPPQNTRNTSSRAATNNRSIRHPGHAVSLRIGKRIEVAFGWVEEAGLRQRLHYSTARVSRMFTLTAVADNLIRLLMLLDAASVPPGILSTSRSRWPCTRLRRKIKLERAATA